MARHLDILTSDPKLRAEMAAASLAIISEHEREHWLAEWETLYGQLAQAGGRA
jgi:hypothetical protein